MAYNTNNVSKGDGWDNSGLSADEVAKLQTAVGATADGYYGNETKAAVKAKSGEDLTQVQAYEKYVLNGTPYTVGGNSPDTSKLPTPSSSSTTTSTITTTAPAYGTSLNDELAAYKKDQETMYSNTGATYDQALSDKQTAIQTATNAAVDQLRSEWENTVSQYDTARNKMAYSKAQATDNLAMQNQANGDRGGMANKLMSDQTAAYDNQMLSIDLEQINLKNQVEQQVAQLIADGKISEAEAAYEIGIAKMEALNNLKNNYYSTTMNVADTLDNRRLTETQAEYTKQIDDYNRQIEQEDRDLNKFYTMLQLGIFDEDAAKALGVPADQAKEYADYINQEAKLSLQNAKLQIQQTLKSLNANKENEEPEVKDYSQFFPGNFTPNELENLNSDINNKSMYVARGGQLYRVDASGNNVRINGEDGWKVGDAIVLDTDTNGNGVYAIWDGAKFVYQNQYDNTIKDNNVFDWYETSKAALGIKGINGDNGAANSSDPEELYKQAKANYEYYKKQYNANLFSTSTYGDTNRDENLSVLKQNMDLFRNIVDSYPGNTK